MQILTTAYAVSCGILNFVLYDDIMIVTRHCADNRRRLCVNMRFSVFPITRRYTIIA